MDDRPQGPDIAAIAILLGDPTRGRMLTALMDGRAQTATELALAGNVLPSTASSHIARLKAAGLIVVLSQGRHRYVRLASPEVADLIERLMHLAPAQAAAKSIPGPRDRDLRRARVCYDHLAGELGVRLLDRLRSARYLRGDDGAMALTRSGTAWCEAIGIDLAALRKRRRPLCLPCLDWSERRTHLAGGLGGALLAQLFALRYARKVDDSRAVHFTPQGEAFLESLALGR